MKLGIIGSGMIVKDFLSIADELPEIELEAIVARNRENLEKLSKKYRIKKIYTNIDEFLTDKDIDTVYVAIPNNIHYSVVKKSLLANINVICEKPFTLYCEEARELFELAESRNLILIEAITNQYLENYYEIKKAVKEIGEIRLIECNFSQLSSRYKDFKEGKIAPVFSKEHGGGVLNDLNIYNIHFIIGIFGEPQTVNYFPNIINDIDTSGVLVLIYDKFKAVCIAAKDTFNNSYVNIQGDKGLVQVTGPTNEVANYSLKTEDIVKENINDNSHSHRMYAEFKKISQVIMERDFIFVNKQKRHSLSVMKVLDKAKKSIG
ncbi:Gfo/Idh/MocA family protein [Gemella bergeri]